MSEKQTLLWTKDGFLDHLSDLNRRMEDRAIAFVIGSGASRPSGIPTGGELVQRWLREIHKREAFGKVALEEWATAENIGIEGFELARAAEFYPRIFERRFRHDPEEGYAFLEAEMEKKEPSLGYSLLAEIMAHTRHKVVVTTNFDNLVADALSIHARQHPLVCGHESLAGFVRPQLRRPLVAKIHRDLFLAPINHTEGVDCLDGNWTKALSRLFEFYTPVVIGYGGNDGSLMDFLDRADIRGGLWWCFRKEDGVPPEKVQALVAEKGGRLVPVIGFDEFMVELGTHLLEKFDLSKIGQHIELLGKARAQRYRDEAEKVQKRIVAASVGKEEELKSVRQAFTPSGEVLDDWWSWELKAQNETDPQKIVVVYREALRRFTESWELAGNFANFLSRVRKDYDEAERFYRKALELEPNAANNTGNFAVFMEEVRKDYDEAERLYRRALELDPNEANHIGNFANFLTHIRKDYDEAERFYRKALKLDPNSVSHTSNFAVFMEEVREDYDEAERLYRRALELDPSNANAVGNFALFMEGARKDYDEAEQLFRRTLELNSSDANHTGNFANFLKHIRKDYDGAERLYRRALELDPIDANHTGNLAGFLLGQKRFEESRDVALRAWSLNEVKTNQLSAEIAFYLALNQTLDGGEFNYLGLLKSLFETGYERGTWTFDGILEKLAPELGENLDFYRAVADAILDEAKVADLERLPEWQAVVPMSLDAELPTE